MFDIPELPPTSDMRRVRVRGEIVLKDYGVFSDARRKTTFDRSVTVSPGASHKQLTINAAKVGDVSLMLRVRVDRNADESVFVNFDARLFDENDAVASTSTNFSIEKLRRTRPRPSSSTITRAIPTPATSNSRLPTTTRDGRPRVARTRHPAYPTRNAR